MPGIDEWSARIRAYYPTVEQTLLDHLRGRPVLGFGRSPTAPKGLDPTGVALHVADATDLDEALRSGIGFFTLPGLGDPDLVALRVRPGLGSGIDTVATTTLALAQSLAADGLARTVMTDGTGGLYLIGFAYGRPEPHPGARRYAAALAATAPEIATTDPADADGRALVTVLGADGPRDRIANDDTASDGAATGIPAPYSLVSGPDGLGAAIPLTMDELAAASAGMPLQIEPEEVAGRIGSLGDLAAALAEATVSAA